MTQHDNKLLDGFKEYFTALNRSPITISLYLSNIRCFQRWLEDNRISSILDVVWQDIERYQAWMLSPGQYTAPSAATYMQSVRAIYQYLAKLSIISSDPTIHVAAPRYQRPLPRNIMTRAEIKRLLDAPDTETNKGILDKTILEVLYGTAIRLSELCGLTVSDVYFLRDELRVKGKGYKYRVQPLSETVASWLHIYMEEVRPKVIADENEAALFIGSDRGRPINSQVVRTMVKRYARQARIKKEISPHTIRSTTATHMLKHGASLPVVQAILGHKWLSTTERYTRVAPNELLRAIRKYHPRERGMTDEA